MEQAVFAPYVRAPGTSAPGIGLGFIVEMADGVLLPEDQALQGIASPASFFRRWK